MSQENFRIRSAIPADMDALYEICLLTADSGVDATGLYGNPKLPGYVWAAPYGALEPTFAFLLTDGERRLGYCIGVPDTAAFEARLDREWWPKVRAELVGFTPTAKYDEMVLGKINTPERHDADQLVDYPAHLHINLLPEVQSGGWGRRLIETELDALRKSGAKGVQLGVSPTNIRAQGFYKHVGFTDISKPGHVTFGMKFR